MTTLEFQLVNDACPTNEPRRGSDGAAGVDVWGIAGEDDYVQIPPHWSRLIYTNLSVQVAKGHYVRIAPRSGLSMRGIMVNGGVIDSDYRGEIGVILHNLTDNKVTVDLAKPIAQLIVEKYEHVESIIVHRGAKRVFVETVRGSDGFGSTDKRPKIEEIPDTQEYTIVVESPIPQYDPRSPRIFEFSDDEKTYIDFVEEIEREMDHANQTQLTASLD